jgi:hypothetical protein
MYSLGDFTDRRKRLTYAELTGKVGKRRIKDWAGNVAQLKAFIDDSGSGGDSPWFVLAGYLGAAEAWDAFDRRWRAALDGPPKLEYFKHSQMYRPETQWGQFKSEGQRNERLDRFIEVIGGHALRAIYVRVKQQDYDEIIEPYVPPMWRNPYYFLFIGFLSSATSTERWAGTSRKIEFFFDNNQEVEKPSQRLYSQVCGLPQFAGSVEGIHYKDEKQFLPLQAADLLAWEVRRRFSVEEPERPQFEMALNCPSEKPFVHTITRINLDELGDTMNEQAKKNWAIMGYPEHLRKWQRPARGALL